MRSRYEQALHASLRRDPTLHQHQIFRMRKSNDNYNYVCLQQMIGIEGFCTPGTSPIPEPTSPSLSVSGGPTEI